MIGPTWTTILYGSLLVVFATQIGAFTTLAADAGKGAHWRKGIGIVLAVFGILMMASGLLTQHGWRERATVERQAGGPEGRRVSGLAWRTDERAALAEALAEGRPALIDFTADWCAACHELDRETWSNPDVVAELARYTIIRIDLTHNTPEIGCDPGSLGSRGTADGHRARGRRRLRWSASSASARPRKSCRY